jgi:hypothetical protein
VIISEGERYARTPSTGRAERPIPGASGDLVLVGGAPCRSNSGGSSPYGEVLRTFAPIGSRVNLPDCTGGAYDVDLDFDESRWAHEGSLKWNVSS